jgi:phytoene synthase
MTQPKTRGEIQAAYEVCRGIARREAKNFYYAFLALPAEKSNAMCAIYAFMRRADDIADDESASIEARRENLQQWLDAWQTARAGGATSDPVFIALRDTQGRFEISDTLLEQLVQGVAMDLASEKKLGASVQTYQTFDELYRYCYLVASVVGLVCIRVFGYNDAAAEKLAEETGIAFQLTNILRDVKEDAERGRVYLPLDDLKHFSVSLESILSHPAGHKPNLNQRELLEFEADRSVKYYESAEKLIPLIDADSRPALRVLVSIYRELLNRIIAADYDVFTQRRSVPTWKKLSILLGGMAPMLVYRVFHRQGER